MAELLRDMSLEEKIGQLVQLSGSYFKEEALVDEAVLRVLRLKNRLGLFENPHKDGDGEQEKTVILCGEHRELAREAVRKSIVLLKNEEGILPLRAGKIAFIGPYIEEEDMDSAWAVIGRREDQVSIRQAAEDAAKGAEVIVLCLGEHRAQSGEAASRTDLSLPRVQLELLKHMAAQGKLIDAKTVAGLLMAKEQLRDILLP